MPRTPAMPRPPCHAAHPRHAAHPLPCRAPPVMLRAVAASRKRPRNGLSPEWLDCTTGARNDPAEDPAPSPGRVNSASHFGAIPGLNVRVSCSHSVRPTPGTRWEPDKIMGYMTGQFMCCLHTLRPGSTPLRSAGSIECLTRPTHFTNNVRNDL